jgi:glycerol transport system ATP-binding protein
MSRIDLIDIGHTYDGAHFAVRGIEERFENGGAYALLGPSGCGKTTLLSIISGILRPTHGRIELDGSVVTDHSIAARNIAQVFQFPVVYESMTVRENLAFPLRNRGVLRAEREVRVAERSDVAHEPGWQPVVAQLAERSECNGEYDEAATGAHGSRVATGRWRRSTHRAP